MEGKKNDNEKVDFSLLLSGMPQALEEVADVLTYGAKKYERNNWKFVPDAHNRYLAAGMRHEILLQEGFARDDETNMHHLAHKICCDLFRLQLLLEKEGTSEQKKANRIGADDNFSSASKTLKSPVYKDGDVPKLLHKIDGAHYEALKSSSVSITMLYLGAGALKILDPHPEIFDSLRSKFNVSIVKLPEATTLIRFI